MMLNSTYQPPDLRGRVALVAGATRGVGRGTALALGEAGAIHKELDQCFQRRGVFGAGGGELFGHGGRSRFHGGKEQGALGTESLDQRSGDDTGFFGDVN